MVTRPRMSVLAYAGQKKVSRLPPSVRHRRLFLQTSVYGIAELIRRQRGGAAVVLAIAQPSGPEMPRSNCSKNGDVEHLVATDAIGMGLNLDVDHIAFAGNRKYDGYQYRQLTAAEMGQIAGRAGRHTRDGTFGVTGRVDPLDDDLVEQIENHHFGAPESACNGATVIWIFHPRAALRRTLDRPPNEEGLARAPTK